MSKSQQGYTRRAFVVLGGAAVGTAALAGTAYAANSHKKLREAIDALKEARDYLDHAHHDFGGHKREAIEHVDRAIHQLKVCLDF